MVDVRGTQDRQDKEVDTEPGLSAPQRGETAAHGSPPLTVVQAEINLRSNALWNKWHRWLKRLGITQVHVPTPGAEEMVRPPPVNLGVRRYWVFLVELTATEDALDALRVRFSPDGTLRALRRLLARRVPQ